MTKKEWASFSDSRKVQHLLDHEFKYRKRPLVNAHATNDSEVISFVSQAVVGGVIMSSWHGSKQLAAEEALENTANFIAGINNQSY